MEDLKKGLESARELRLRMDEALRRFHAGDDEEATRLFVEVEEAARAAGNGLRLQQALMYRGIILFRSGDYDGALALFQEQETICRRLGLRPYLVMALGNQALVLAKSDDREKAESALSLFDEVLGMCREESDERGLWQTLTNKGRFLYDLDFDHVRARAVFRESVESARRLGDGGMLAMALLNEAECLGFDEVPEIRRMCEEALPLAEATGDQKLIRRITDMLKMLDIPER
jgi:tetratricopeptide (TPR) repeat protein